MSMWGFSFFSTQGRVVIFAPKYLRLILHLSSSTVLSLKNSAKCNWMGECIELWDKMKETPLLLGDPPVFACLSSIQEALFWKWLFLYPGGGTRGLYQTAHGPALGIPAGACLLWAAEASFFLHLFLAIRNYKTLLPCRNSKLWVSLRVRKALA